MENKNCFSVYIHKCPNGKVYIGITSKDCKERWKNGKGYLNNAHFTQAIKKYGWSNIEHIIVAKNLTKEKACEIEQQLIKEYNSTDREKGYNKSIGGECSSLGFKHSTEAKKKISQSAKGRYIPTETRKQASKNRMKAVDVYNLQKQLIKHCESVRDAEEFTGVDNSNIVATCKGKYQQTNGFIFRYSGESVDLPTVTHRKPVKMFSLDGEYIKTFPTIKAAARELNIPDTHIIDCCKGKFKKSGGYIWKYA